MLRRSPQVSTEVDGARLSRVSGNEAVLTWILPHVDQFIAFLDQALHEPSTVADPISAVSSADVLQRYKLIGLMQRNLVDDDV